MAFLFLSQWVWADVSPLSLTFFGLYGMPVEPLGLASTTSDGFGFDALAEWNFSNNASLGLSFEQATFYYSSSLNFTVPMANMEGRLFPFENGKDKFSPYIYGGAGLNLSNTAGPVQLKAGLGSRVSFVGPLYIDIAAGSHWIQPPNDFQYVDLRAGLSYSFEFKAPEAKKASPTPTPASTSTPLFTPIAPVPLAGTPTATPPVLALEVATPTLVPVISQAPVTTLAQSKKYYKIGMNAFLAGNYPLALKALKKSLTLKEKHRHPYKYAETYATIGVIYQFHANKVPNHDQKALIYYKKALAIDPTTKSAKHYYRKLKAKVAKEKKTKLKAAARPTDESTAPASPGESTQPPSSGNPGQPVAPSSSATPPNYF